MPTRRDFVTTVAGAAAYWGTGLPAVRGDLSPTANPGAQPTQPKRREVRIGGKRVKVVDVHAHCVIPEVADVVKGTNLAGNAGPGGGVGRGGGGRAGGGVGGANNVLGSERLRIMDEQGLDIQALSINGYWWYAADPELARRIVSVQNEGLAKWVAAHPDRFVAFASVALQHPDLAAEQLDDAVKRLGLRGASIGGHVAGEDVSLAKYDPFWAKAAELGVLVFMHPGGADNVVRENALRGRGDLGNIIGNPLETTVFLSRLIFDGTLDKFPGLRVCASHAGGYLPSYLGRTDVACTVRPNANCANKKHPTEYFKRELLVDTMVFREEGLRHLVAEMGVSQIVYGTDIPFNWPVGVDLVLNASFLKDAEKEAILGGTLMKLLRITTT